MRVTHGTVPRYWLKLRLTGFRGIRRIQQFRTPELAGVDPVLHIPSLNGGWWRFSMIVRLLLPCVLLMSFEQQNVQADDSRWIVQQKRGMTELYSEVGLDTTALWSHLQDVKSELSETLGLTIPTGDVQVMVFRDQASYVKYLSGSLPQARFRRALYYKNQQQQVSQIYVWNSRHLITDLRHEMTHVLLHLTLPYVPLWMDEGFATYFETPAAQRPKSDRISSVRWSARFGRTPSLQDLEQIPSAEAMDLSDYRSSWAWTAFLLNESPESREICRKYVSLIQRGEAPDPMSRFGAAEISDFQSRANSYFKKMTIRLTSDSSLSKHEPGPVLKD
jgi:hypothetical protein